MCIICCFQKNCMFHENYLNGVKYFYCITKEKSAFPCSIRKIYKIIWSYSKTKWNITEVFPWSSHSLESNTLHTFKHFGISEIITKQKESRVVLTLVELERWGEGTAQLTTLVTRWGPPICSPLPAAVGVWGGRVTGRLCSWEHFLPQLCSQQQLERLHENLRFKLEYKGSGLFHLNKYKWPRIKAAQNHNSHLK